ncbi:MAG TPA: TauD/TfdA family dioxygenase [Methylomirabilota bacterium]|jgi:alpha-ketoglutarate-dependent taurine dioxygenase|nr:TauD/TfdA family dioxygenase [Methylomirabilota bacterium]
MGGFAEYERYDALGLADLVRRGKVTWDALPEDRKDRLQGLVVEHSIVYSRSLIGYRFSEVEAAALPPVQQTLVRTHPVTRRRSLFLGSPASHILGWPVDEGRKLLVPFQLVDTKSVHERRTRCLPRRE